MDLTSGGGTDVQDLLPGQGGGTGDGKHDLIDAVTLCRFGDFLSAAHNGNTAQAAVDLGGIIIDDTDHIIVNELAVNILHDEGSASLPGTDQHDPLDPAHMSHMVQLLHSHPNHPVGKTDAHRTHKAEEKSDHHAGTGNQRSVKAEKHHTDHSQYRIGSYDAENL